MRPKTCFIRLTATVAIFALSLLATNRCAAGEKVLHAFSESAKDGRTTVRGWAADATGNLYGTTREGGAHASGTVFEMTPVVGGGWTEKVLYSFTEKPPNAYYPDAGLIFDAAGNLYGTTEAGGTSNFGTVFELSPVKDGGWREKVLHSFAGADGSTPYASLIFDGSGNLYGTTEVGGAYGYGTVFELVPGTGGTWTQKVLYSFTGTHGTNPYASLILDASGNLYSTTQTGGAYGHGTVFELIPSKGGHWTEKILHNFNNPDGTYPSAGLIFDTAGNLYGTSVEGGTYNLGTVFELTPTGGGGWTETVLHSFGGADGSTPSASLVFDSAGNLYGTTGGGGTGSCGQYQGSCGTVFELTPATGGGWTETVLHDFARDEVYFPYAGVILDAAGNLYGTASSGGSGKGCGKPHCGAVFELTPLVGGGWTETVLHNFHTQPVDGYDPEAGLIFSPASRSSKTP